MHAGTIVAEGLTKSYRVPVREPGFLAGLRGVIAPRYAEKVARQLSLGQRVRCDGAYSPDRSASRIVIYASRLRIEPYTELLRSHECEQLGQRPRAVPVRRRT